MSINIPSRKKCANQLSILSKTKLIALLIIIISINSSIASQKLVSELQVTKQGTKFHYKIITPTFWDINQTHNVTLNFEIDDIGKNIDVVERKIGLHIKDDNNFTQYRGFQQFGPFINIESSEDLNRLRKKMIGNSIPAILLVILNSQIDSIVYDVYGRIVPLKYVFAFTIDLFIFDLLENLDPNKLVFYLSFSLYEAKLDTYDIKHVENDNYATHKSEWEKVAEYRIKLADNNRSIPIWMWLAVVVLLIKSVNIKRK